MRHLVLGMAAAAAWIAGGRSPDSGIARVAWMAGCWELTSGTRVVEEQWTRPRGGMMLGVGRTVRGDTLIEYEQVRLFERGGHLVYAAAPSGQAPAEFVSTVLSDSAVTFENPDHDFPQRVIYRRGRADSLLARVEGVSHGKLHGVDFPYAHVACP